MAAPSGMITWSKETNEFRFEKQAVFTRPPQTLRANQVKYVIVNRSKKFNALKSKSEMDVGARLRAN